MAIFYFTLLSKEKKLTTENTEIKLDYRFFKNYSNRLNCSNRSSNYLSFLCALCGKVVIAQSFYWTLLFILNKEMVNKMKMNKRMQEAWDVALDILKPTKSEIEHGIELHKNSVVIDSYGFGPGSDIDRKKIKLSIESGASNMELQNMCEDMNMTRHTTNPELQKEYKLAWNVSGVTCTFRNAGEEGQDPLRIMKRLANFVYTTDMMRDFIPKVVKPDDIVTAKKEKRHCIYLTCNGVPLSQQWVSVEEEMQYIKYFFYFGSRMMHLTYNRRNMLGDGCAEPANAGLSDFGRTVIHEMNRLGIIIDVAHSGWQTSLEAAQVSELPIFASHTVCAEVNMHCRAKPDKVIHTIANKEGAIGICCIPGFLGGKGDISSLFDHIDYVVKKFGADYVMIGTDTGYVCKTEDVEKNKIQQFPKKRTPWRSFWPPGSVSTLKWNKPRQKLSMQWTNWPLFTVGLVQRGYSDSDIQKIIGGNALRVAREVFNAGCKS